jgi:hypothetical protein
MLFRLTAVFLAIGVVIFWTADFLHSSKSGELEMGSAIGQVLVVLVLLCAAFLFEYWQVVRSCACACACACARVCIEWECLQWVKRQANSTDTHLQAINGEMVQDRAV